MLNQVTLQGRLVDDLKPGMIIHTADGDKVKYTFTVASQDEFGKKATQFVPCAAWGKTGEFISKWFKKGYMIFLNGRLTSYKDFGELNGATVLELTVSRADFPSEKNVQLSEAMEDVPPIEAPDEDLPF